MKLKPVWTDINPKAVTTDELFGYLHPATREWKDGEGFQGSCRKIDSQACKVSDINEYNFF